MAWPDDPQDIPRVTATDFMDDEGKELDVLLDTISDEIDGLRDGLGTGVLGAAASVQARLATNDTAVTAAASAAATAATAAATAQTTAAAAIPLTQKGAASGVASLDSGGAVPLAQLPSGLPSTPTDGSVTEAKLNTTLTTTIVRVVEEPLNILRYANIAGTQTDDTAFRNACTTALQDAVADQQASYLTGANGLTQRRPIILPSNVSLSLNANLGLDMEGFSIMGDGAAVEPLGPGPSIRLRGGANALFATPSGTIGSAPKIKNLRIRGDVGYTCATQLIPAVTQQLRWLEISGCHIDWMYKVVDAYSWGWHLTDVWCTNLTGDGVIRAQGADTIIERVGMSHDMGRVWPVAWKPAVLMELALAGSRVKDLYLTPSDGAYPLRIFGGNEGTEYIGIRCNGLNTVRAFAVSPADWTTSLSWTAGQNPNTGVGLSGETYKGLRIQNKTAPYEIWRANGAGAGGWTLWHSGVTGSGAYSARPGSPAQGDAYYCTDLGRCIRWDGSRWRTPQFAGNSALDGSGAWTIPDNGVNSGGLAPASDGADGPAIFIEQAAGPATIKGVYVKACGQYLTSGYQDGIISTYDVSGFDISGVQYDAPGNTLRHGIREASAGWTDRMSFGPSVIDAYPSDSNFLPAANTKTYEFFNMTNTGADGTRRVTISDWDREIQRALPVGTTQALTVSSTTLQDVNYLQFTPESGGSYEVEGVLEIDGPAAADVKLALAIPTGSETFESFSVDAAPGGVVTAAGSTLVANLNGAGSTSRVAVPFRARLTAGTGGTVVKLRAAQNTSDVGTVTIRGGRLTARRIY